MRATDCSLQLNELNFVEALPFPNGENAVKKLIVSQMLLTIVKCGDRNANKTEIQSI